MVVLLLVTASLIVGFLIGLFVGKNKGDIKAEAWHTSHEISTIKNTAHVVEEARLNVEVKRLTDNAEALEHGEALTPPLTPEVVQQINDQVDFRNEEAEQPVHRKFIDRLRKKLDAS